MMVESEIRDLRHREKKLLEAIAVSKANLDRLYDDRVQLKAGPESKQRDRLVRRLRDNRRKLETVRARLKARRTRTVRIRERISKLKARLSKPRIIDLNLAFKPMSIQGRVDKVIGHYTAGPQDQNTADAIRLCRLYHQAHLNQGWSGEAYHLCFTVDGDILLLRPARYVGAHTLNFNTGSYGIMCHGTTGDTPTKAQKRAMRWWAKNGHTQRMGKGQTQKRPGGYHWGVHKDYNATACPGDFASAYRSQGQ